MENQFIVGKAYSIEDIEKQGFSKTRQTSVLLFYRKNDVLLVFDIPKPLAPKLFKLIAIHND